MHDRVCLFKTTGKRKGDSIETPTKKRQDNVKYIGGALENTLADYRLDLEDENQDDIFAVLKHAVFQLKNKVREEIMKKKAIKVYVSLHADFHLSMDTTFITEPPLVLNTGVVEVLESSDIDGILCATYE